MRFGKLIRKLQFLRRILASDRMREMVYEEECIKHEGRTNYYSRLARERAVECGEHLKVNNPCVFTGKVHFANNCNFNGMSVIGNGEVFFGNNFHSGTGCQIITQNHNYEGNSIPYDATLNLLTVVIEDNVWFGNNVLIVGNLTIGEGAIIAAGAIITKDVPPYSIVGGVNKVLKSRNVEHYKLLKTQNKVL